MMGALRIAQQEWAPLADSELSHNALYICCAVHAYPDQFDENGAVAMNHMLQERAGLTRVEAFKVVSDTVKLGLVRLEKRGAKRLVVVEETFKPFRDRMIDRIGRVQAEVVTFNWHLHRPRSLTEPEKQGLAKHVKKGRLWDLKQSLPDRLAKDVVAHVEQLGGGEKQVRNPFEAEKAKFAEVMSEALHRLAKDMVGKDFVLVVVRSGDTIRPAMKIIERETQLQLEF